MYEILQGSLSRALGLKIKQDLHARRESEKRKSEDRDSTPLATPVGGMLGSNSFIPPPLPPSRPQKFMGSGGRAGSTEDSSISSNSTGHYHQPEKIALYARPHSALNFHHRTSLISPGSSVGGTLNGGHAGSSKGSMLVAGMMAVSSGHHHLQADIGEKAEDTADEESAGLTSDNTTSGGESSSKDISEEISKTAHRRSTSISKAGGSSASGTQENGEQHVPIHTPV